MAEWHLRPRNPNNPVVFFGACASVRPQGIDRPRGGNTTRTLTASELCTRVHMAQMSASAATRQGG